MAKLHGTGSIVPALAKIARAGHPQFWNGKERTRQKDGPPAGGLTATYDTGTKATLSFNYSDWLGTKRVQSNFSGTTQNSWTTDPFGAYQHPTGSAADATEYHFTGKEHDSESGNDYFGARSYESGSGRFISPDGTEQPTVVAFAIYGNPQTLNRYSYVYNAPSTAFDPDGHQTEAPGEDAEDAKEAAPEGNDLEAWREGVEEFEANVRAEAEAEAAAQKLATQPDPLVASNNGDDPVTGICYVNTPSTAQANTARLEAGYLPALTQSWGLPAQPGIGPYREGTFSVAGWYASKYPAERPRPPEGTTFRMLEGQEYKDARSAANKDNRERHENDPTLKGKDIHEITPVKFGGSPTDSANKEALTRAEHSKVTTWWNELMRSLTSR